MTQHFPNAGESRSERGHRALAEIDGQAGHEVVAALADIAPDFATYVLEFPFGDIYSRPGLDLRSREIATIAALAAMGNAAPQLNVHIEAGLNVGLSRDEIVEILMQMAVMPASRPRSTVCSQRRRCSRGGLSKDRSRGIGLSPRILLFQDAGTPASFRIGIGGSLTAAPLPHHRTYGSVSGGSVGYADCGAATVARPSDLKNSFDKAMLSAGLAASRQGPCGLPAV